ncbi:MAG TPA: serine hydrolase [Vicinamibacterales bacterium]|nr:serine hydrolase [Vicinamibacterales bacterium]
MRFATSMTARAIGIALLLLALPRVAAADLVDDIVNAALKRQGVPGVSVAIVRDGSIVKAEGYGLANTELDVRATPQTVYQIGSVSKQFIAAGIMLLVQDGKMSLDDKASKYLAGTPAAWQAITVRHLLTHTAGIVNEPPAFDPFKLQSDADLVKSAYSAPMLFVPGADWAYSNTGYFALADIIRTVSGEPWDAFLQKRLFRSLAMTSTRTTTMEMVSNRASGYTATNGKMSNAPPILAVRPSGAFLSTVLDLAKWDAALSAGSLLPAATLNQMWEPVRLNGGGSYPYGFGWQVDTVAGHKRVHHSGTMPGFRATIQRYLDDRLTVIVLVNAGTADPGSIARQIAESYVPDLVEPRPAAPQRTAIKVDPSSFDAYVGRYQPNPAITVTVSREGDKLMFESAGGKVELLPDSENSFFSNALPITISFVKDETGKVTHLILLNDGREAGRARKIE